MYFDKTPTAHKIIKDKLIKNNKILTSFVCHTL